MIGYDLPLAPSPSFLRPCNFLLFVTTFLIIRASAYASTPLCLSNQSSALLQFKRGIALEPDKLSSWKKGSNCCHWRGVTCDNPSGFVTKLQIPGVSDQNSSTFDPSLFELSHLRVLDLRNNKFNDTLPNRLAELIHLTHLDLSGCSFSGTVDESIIQLHSLSSINLSGNKLLNIPSGIFLLPKLEMLDVSSNADLVASLPSKAIPLSSNIQHLDLNGAKKLYGDLQVLSNLSRLSYLDLESCAINGSIPSSWASKRIAEVYLSLNNLNGSIPQSFCSSSNLTFLYLSGNFLSGTIPSCLFNMSSLKAINLSANLLSSGISSVFNLPSVESIDVSHNLLTGSIHSSIFNLPTLSDLRLDDNQLTGEITASIVNLPSLPELNLSNNMLTGSIPSFLFTLPYVDTLDLSNNKFNGSLPYFSGASQLNHLWLDNNCLSGVIPSSISNLSYLFGAMLSSNCYNGSANLSPFLNLNQLTRLDFSNNKGLTALELSNSYSYDSSTSLSLAILDLSSCNIKSFPTFLQKLHLYQIKLDLSDNGIRGNIPSWLWEIHGIETLLLDFNEIEGFEAANKSSIADSIRYFSASGNRIAGEIPTFICNFTQLSVLDMTNNNLTGTIPNCLGSLNLHVLGLAKNQLQGQIPVLRNTFVSLVSLNNNLLSGKIDPEALYNCTNLQLLDLGDNQLNDTFPSWLSSYVNMKVLVLRSNHLHGPITLSGSAQVFSSLHIFDISGNHFSGSLPHELFKSLKAMMENESKAEAGDENGIESFLNFPFISNILVESNCPECAQSKMTYYMAYVEQTIKSRTLMLSKIRRTLAIIDLSNNMFTNKIPEEVGILKGLWILNISNNNLSGTIPKSLGNVKQMEALDLSHNHLSGVIPVELTTLTSLAILNLSYNELWGRIPEGHQFSTFDETSFEGNPGLCGFQVQRLCSSGRDNDGVHQRDKKEKQWEYGALGFGFAVGILLIAVPVMLSERFNNWYWNIIDRMVEFCWNSNKLFSVKFSSVCCT